MPSKNIYWFEDIISDDIHIVGEKGVKLSDLLREGILIPEGFAVTSHAFDEFVKENSLDLKSKHLMQTANHKDPHSVSQISKHIKKYFNQGQLNSGFKLDIYNAYKKIGGNLTDSHVKITLSPISESHATKHNHEWNEVKGEASLIHSIKECWGSNFSEINLINNHEHSPYVKSVIVQRVINPDKSGKIYTIDPTSYSKDKVIIKAMLGEFSDQTNLVSMPDVYEVDKKSHDVITHEQVPQKKLKRRSGGIKKIINVTKNHKKKLTKKEIDELLNQAKKIEKIAYFPQEIDWVEENGKIYFVHTKPITNIN